MMHNISTQSEIGRPIGCGGTNQGIKPKDGDCYPDGWVDDEI